MLMDAANDGTGGTKGGGGSGGGSDPAKEIDSLKTQNADLLKRLDALEKKGNPGQQDDDKGDLAAKAKADQDAKDKAASESKALESALKFSLAAKDWIKNNENLLPKTIAAIVEQADKEKYENAIEKDRAIKSGIIKAYFEVQSNLDLLTDSQKSTLEDFLKLTKTGKETRAQEIYNQIFEPTLESARRQRKADQLAKGHADTSTGEEAYKKRLMERSEKHYLGDKNK